MTEQELIEEGFTKVDVYKDQSGDKEDYYYYNYHFKNGAMMYSSESDISTRSKWIVYFDDYPEPITDIIDVQTLIGLFNKWSKN